MLMRKEEAYCMWEKALGHVQGRGMWGISTAGPLGQSFGK
jgi:hypothetical protein